MLINLTPHAVTLFSAEGHQCTIEATGDAARVSESLEALGTVTVSDQRGGSGVDFEVVTVVTSNVIGLPNPVSGTLYVVSRMVAEACRDRDDLVFPVDLVRNEDGSVIGCKRLGKIGTSEL